jgi:membrane protein
MRGRELIDVTALTARRTVRRTRVVLRGHDLLLYAGGVTFYAALASVPGLFVALRIAAALAGRGHVLQLGSHLANALPDQLGAPQVARSLVDRAVDLRWRNVAVSLLPATLYGEGLRRAFARLRGADERYAGWRGRLALLPVLAAAPALLLVLLAVTPQVGGLMGTGPWRDALGVVLAFVVDWLLMSAPLVWVFRVVAPDPPGWVASVVGGVLTASFLAGFLQGFVLFLSLPLDLGAPFGGLTAVGGTCAVLLWLWVLHLVVLIGFTLTREAGRTGGGADAEPRPRIDATTRQI